MMLYDSGLCPLGHGQSGQLVHHLRTKKPDLPATKDAVGLSLLDVFSTDFPITAGPECTL